MVLVLDLIANTIFPSVEMAYHPPMTLVRTIAEGAGWQTVCGTEVVAVSSMLWLVRVAH